MKTSKELRYQNLLQLIAEAGSAAELARRTESLRESYISQIVTRVKTRKGTVRGVGDVTARQCERAMHKPTGWMDQPHDTDAEINEPSAPYRHGAPGQTLVARLYPLISWVQAGHWTDTGGQFVAQDAEEWMPCSARCGPRTFALRVQGASMEDKFFAGDLIFVDPDREPTDKSFVVVRLDDSDQATFKQLIIEGDRRYLRAYNPRWPEPIIEINGAATLCGVVVFRGNVV